MEMRAGRIVLLVFGVLLAMMAVGLMAVGGIGLWAHTFLRDDAGYLTTPTVDLAADGYALTVEQVELDTVPGDWPGRQEQLDIQLTATSRTGQDVFLGIAPDDVVQDYLRQVPHARIVSIGDDPGETRYDLVPGDAEPAGPPTSEPFWSEAVSGPGTQTLTWTAAAGTWSAVIMNADASPGVEVLAEAGARTDLLLPVSLALLVIGLLVLGAGSIAVVAAVRPTGPAPAAAPVAAVSAAPTPTPYPLALRGHLDPTVSRWQWLVKWLLLIPHFLVLAVLWLVFVVLTVVAGFAILFKGRYPRGIFDFNVGVLRWTWRVAFYGYGVLGTDRYPPFSLDGGDHPAELTVAYPETLSRGLVLVKWWLLAIPHYLIVGILTGGGVSWTMAATQDTSWEVSFAGGLIGLLALIAGVVLLFSARYPQGLFDLLMGFNRWVYRVIAYAALMTDVYPPFRLDGGAEEPPVVPRPPTPGPADTERPRPTTPVSG
jgi:hypothetical protein